jgi:serine/threonine protein kinase
MSVKVTEAKIPKPKPHHTLAMYKDYYIANELINGKEKPSTSSDVYSFAKLIQFAYRKLGLPLNSLVKRAITAKRSSDRRTLENINNDLQNNLY